MREINDYLVTKVERYLDNICKKKDLEGMTPAEFIKKEAAKCGTSASYFYAAKRIGYFTIRIGKDGKRQINAHDYLILHKRQAVISIIKRAREEAAERTLRKKLDPSLKSAPVVDDGEAAKILGLKEATDKEIVEELKSRGYIGLIEKRQTIDLG